MPEKHREKLKENLQTIAGLSAKSPCISNTYLRQANEMIMAYVYSWEGCKANSTLGEVKRMELIRQYLEMVEHAKRK